MGIRLLIITRYKDGFVFGHQAPSDLAQGVSAGDRVYRQVKTAAMRKNACSSGYQRSPLPFCWRNDIVDELEKMLNDAIMRCFLTQGLTNVILCAKLIPLMQENAS